MTEETALDRAWEAMAAAPGDDAARLRFYERLADGELFLLLEREAEGDRIAPRLFPLDEGPFVLVFDREERLTDFAAGPAPHAAMSGRQVVRLLAGQGLGLGLNLGAGASEMLLPAEAVTWLAELLSNAPREAEERVEELRPPGGLPEVLLTALDTKLATAQGLASAAYLSGVTYVGGRRSHLLAFVDAIPGAERALAEAAGEALTFSGLEAGEMDVAFFAAAHPMTARLARWGLRFDLPVAERDRAAPKPPGSDPGKPPILRRGGGGAD